MTNTQAPEAAPPDAAPPDADASADAIVVIDQPGDESVIAEAAADPSRWRDVRLGAGAFALYLAASIAIYALPVITRFDRACVGACVPDTSIYIWSMRWMTWAIGHGHDPFTSPLVWAPDGTNLTWVTFLPGPGFIMSPVTTTFGPVVTVNLLMVLAPALAGWGAYLVCRQATRSYWAAVVGGSVFGFSTYMTQHMRSHVNLLLIFFVPLAVYLVTRRIRGRLHPAIFVPLLALVLVGQFSVSSELAATATMFGGIALVGVAVAAGSALRPRVLMTGALIAASYALAALLLSPFLTKALDAAPEGSIRPLDKNSVDLLSFLLPRRSLLIGGDAFAATTNTFPGLASDDTAYLSIPLLVMLGWFAWERRHQLSTWLLVGFVVVAGILALGPVLHIAGDPSVAMPGRIVASLPLIRHALPERFPAYLFLALAVIAALFLAAGQRRRWSGRLRYALVLAGVAMLLTDTWGGIYHGDLRMPAFFADGTYASYFEPEMNVLAFPAKLGDDLRWQVEADMSFRLARTYIGPEHIGGDTVGLGSVFSTAEGGLPSVDRLQRFITERGVGAVVVEEPADPSVTVLLDDALGAAPTSVGGVLVYRVPPALPDP